MTETTPSLLKKAAQGDRRNAAALYILLQAGRNAMEWDRREEVEKRAEAMTGLFGLDMTDPGALADELFDRADLLALTFEKAAKRAAPPAPALF